jgi:uroporphyrinogen-III synthase
MVTTPMRVLVTRPAQEAARWVADLCAAGLEAMALPLIAIEPAGDEARHALQVHRDRIDEYRALMFVSAAAVEHFFVEPPLSVAERSATANTRYWATGPGTVSALRRAGIPVSRIDAPAQASGRFDSETLWALVRTQLIGADRVLIVRGGDADDRQTGRDWLARQIESVGAVCEQAVAYRRLVPAFSERDRTLAEAAAMDGAVWLFSSSEAIGNLLQWLPATSWRQARAVATHPRIAQAAVEVGFGRVITSQPVLSALTASIESLR